MGRSSQWSIPLAVIGSILIASATFLQYAKAHRAGQPGGYFPIILGALVVGLLATLCSYFSQLKLTRSASVAVLSGATASIAFFAVLLATLISCFGS